MQRIHRAVLTALLGGLLCAAPSTASAAPSKIFAGCITDRTDTTVTLTTSARESITIDTTWLKQAMKDELANECVTISTSVVEGKYMAESVEAGVDGPSTADRTNQSDQEDHNGSNSGNKND